MTESYILALLSELSQDSDSYKIIICKDEAEAQKLKKDVLELAKNFLTSESVFILPGFFQTGLFKYESAKKIIAARLNLAHKLSIAPPRLIIASTSGFTRAFPNLSWIQNNTIELKIGAEYDFDVLLTDLEKRVYSEVPQVEEVGEYSVRGSILDIWTPGHPTPIRIEFLDNTIEKIKLFRTHDQKSYASLENAFMLPAREFIWPNEDELALKLEQFNSYILKQKVVGINRSNLFEDLKASVPFPGIDDLSYMFSHPFSSFFTEFQKNLAKNTHAKIDIEWVSSDEEIEKSMRDIQTIYAANSQNDANKNILTAKFETLFPGISDLKNISHVKNPLRLLENYHLPDSILKNSNFLSNNNRTESSSSKETFHTRCTQLKNFLQDKIFDNILVATKNKDSALEIAGLLEKYFPEIDTTEVKPWSFSCLKTPNFNKDPEKILTILLDIEGYFFLKNSNTLVISEDILRGRTTNTRFEDFSATETKTSNSQIFFATQFSDFTEGDIVVHVQHGICRFRGLATIKISDILNDFLVLEFADNDKIYIPVNKLNLIQKYIGTSNAVQLDSLKSKAWEKRKEKAKKDVQELAQKLIEHHAKQISTPGTAFSKIGEDYIAFEDAFPYDETADQIKATQEIMADMSSPKAMDRLLCGDVGFGKTEVAMRACYRAVLDGKQVAWLVPTTVLAHQHLRTLIERFKPFGVNVQMLDRSASSSKILEQLKNGSVDILIGTHRILANDIKFRDLGLLVVDEEQHFGVLQKEKIKSMSYGIDVLTLTATPIPRTLQMALVGIRELSLLTTPPKTRLATKTFVCPFEDQTIIDAITFELERGGQIFYVHNRVEELESIKTYLSTLLPKLKIAIGHGKMSQNDLEKTVVAFLEEKYNLLLCTTIVEAGIDMPNVNTIIVQNADSLGLAQLYQLRGRVGRRSTRGYAYFLVQSERFSLNSDGMKRLEILKDHQELGSGFVIASQDLEMRGSGEILGDEQSGKVSEIGLETYLQMLDDAIKHIGGVRVEHKAEVDIQIPLTIQIPEHYIESSRERLLMYRRFFGSRDEPSLMSLIQECEDRFGKLPTEMEDLAELSRIRRLLLRFGAISLVVGDDATECRLDQKILQADDSYSEAFVKRVLDLCNRQSKNMRITQDGRILFPLKRKQFVHDKKAALLELKRVLSLLAGV